MRDLIGREWYGARPEIAPGEEFDGQQTTDVCTDDPDSDCLGKFLSARFPQASECLLCGYKWVEQPGEDDETCPGCGRYIGWQLG